MTQETSEYQALIGFDWADSHHDLCVAVLGEDKPRQLRVSSDPIELHAFLVELHREIGGGRVAVCIEQTRGAAAYALAMHDFIDIYPVNPVQVKNYRESFWPSGAKNDPGDASVMLDLLRTHREKLTCQKPESAEIRKLRALCEDRRRFVDERADWCNEIGATLKLYYPQALSVANGNLTSEMFCAFLLKWPRFEQFAAARDDTVRKFLYAQRVRSEKRIHEILRIKNQSTPLTNDEAVIEPNVLRVQRLAQCVRQHNQTEKEYNRRIHELEASLEDSTIFRSFPGAGQSLAPRLLAAFGSDRSRFDSAEDVNTYMGTAPVIERSGKKCWVHWRWNCPSFLRQTLVEFARTSIGQSEWARAYYRKARNEDHMEHQAALRSLAFKWVRIIYRCWQNGAEYDENRYIQALSTKGSPLAKKLQC